MVNGVSWTSECTVRLEQFGPRTGVFEVEELAVLSDGVLWIWTVCEEILPRRNVTFIFDLFHALEYAAAMQALCRARANGSRRGRHSYYEANMERMRCDLYSKWGLPVGSGNVESACKHIVGNRFKNRYAAGRKRSPTLCSPSDAASKTYASPTSSNGGFVMPQ